MLVHLVRARSFDEGTLGALYVGRERVCYTIELPWRGNQPNISCFSAGTYTVEYLPRSASGRYRDVYWVRGVPGRYGCLFHAGNFAGDVALGFRTDSNGCILTATRLGRLGGQLAGLGSRSALASLHEAVGRQSFTLVVKEVWA